MKQATLIEAMIAAAVSALLAAGIYTEATEAKKKAEEVVYQ